ncbi:hypothetical protein [Oxalobacter paraformigenes]|uniref:Uncharacterized protein n=1 Tax=Oxalobacter paraformigenes TaxID=556268 RepID=T5LUQ3_9BURK|nr:hypothetical protein [Oxalobacter paraformigenes]EQM95223.1 hypothetical protein OFAG_02219 [Oxalobacter paraformigenes]
MYNRILTFAFSIACLLAMVMFMQQASTVPYGVSHHSVMMKIAHHTSGLPHAASEAPPSARV